MLFGCLDAFLGQLVDGFQHGIDADVDILLCGGEFGVAHDLLDHAGRDILGGQGGGSGMTAGVGCQAATACPGEGFVVDLIEVILVYPDQLLAGCVLAEIGENGDDDICQDDGGFPAFPGLHAGTYRR